VVVGTDAVVVVVDAAVAGTDAIAGSGMAIAATTSQRVIRHTVAVAPINVTPDNLPTLTPAEVL